MTIIRARVTGSTLDEANGLYAEALTRRARGDLTGALNHACAASDVARTALAAGEPDRGDALFILWYTLRDEILSLQDARSSAKRLHPENDV